MDSEQTGGRVAFFGGSFDPPHAGHLAVARAARDALRLRRVLFAPVGTQPLKLQGSMSSFDDRVTMTRLAIAGERGFEVSLVDAPRAEGDGRPNRTPNHTPNYTIDTLELLRATLPQAELFCLMGADSFLSLRKWYRAAEVPFAAALIVASRPGQPLEDLRAALPRGLTLEPEGDKNSGGVEVRTFSVVDAAGRRTAFYLLPGLHVDVSASAIRALERAAAGSIVGSAGGDRLLPPPVAEYIRARGLYSSKQ